MNNRTENFGNFDINIIHGNISSKYVFKHNFQHILFNKY